MKAKIHFSNGEAKFLSEYGKPIHILVTNSLIDEYRLYHVATRPDPQLERRLQEFPSTWAKTGGLGVVSLPPIYVEVKIGVDPVEICQ